jgi:hypothetical protein
MGVSNGEWGVLNVEWGISNGECRMSLILGLALLCGREGYFCGRFRRKGTDVVWTGFRAFRRRADRAASSSEPIARQG